MKYHTNAVVDQGKMHMGSVKGNSNQRAIGIDLGTTNSAVAFLNVEIEKSTYSARDVVVIGDENSGQKLLPSVVYYKTNRTKTDCTDEIIVGEVRSTRMTKEFYITVVIL